MTGLSPAKARIAERGVLENPSPRAGLSLMFAVGERPSASDIERLLDSESAAKVAVQISHRPEESAGWLELLTSGLALDLAGLAPAGGTDAPPASHHFGTSPDIGSFALEAIALTPGPHLEGAGGMLPVVRTMAGLAADLVAAFPVKAVCWNPSASWMAPDYFSRIVTNWLSGGPFPALGLTAVTPASEGAVESVGLNYFTGQELRVEGASDDTVAETVKTAVRVIDYLIGQGPLTAIQEIEGPSGQPLLAEPSADGRQVRVWQGVRQWPSPH
ncbi:MAG: hypothetical protein H6917_09020 [Novosphingobium sp.]|nr:hypothetical protein [Novosphingobium sp.]MCP5402515.1 hypothetical protein [Novosphingobium sp.]